MARYILNFLLVLSTFFWAINFHVAQYALAYYSPMGVAAFRFLFGVLSLFLFLYIKNGSALFRIRFSSRELAYIFVTSFFGIFLTIYFFNKGLMTTSAINGALIETTNPIVIAVFSIFFLNQKLTLKQWVAILISFVGVLIVLTQAKIAMVLNMQFNPGDIYIMLMVIFFSISQMIIKRYLRHVDAVVMTAISALISLGLFTIFSFDEMMRVGLPNSISFWGSILAMGVLGTGIAYTAFYFGVVAKGATSTTLYLNLIPFFAVLIAYFIGGEIYPSQIIGGVVIILGILLFLRKPYSKKT